MEKLFTIELTTISSLEVMIRVLKVLQERQVAVKDFSAQLWLAAHSYRNICIKVSMNETVLRNVIQQLDRLDEVMTVTARETKKESNYYKSYGRG